MDIREILSPDRVVLDLRPRSKPRVLQDIAQQFNKSDPSLDADRIATALQAREQLGSTGLGNGFALPHARIDTLPTYRGLFVRLDKPLAFEAIDGEPVTMIFALLMPGSETSSHVGALAAISRLFRDTQVRDRLRTVKASAEAFRIMTEG
jgi:PTS system nitrogen regulatory IIA component